MPTPDEAHRERRETGSRTPDEEDEEAGGPDGPSPRPSAGSGTGLDSNVAGALSYLLGLITGVLFLVLEKDDRSVRYHAYQSIGFCVLWVGLSIATSVLAVVPVIGWLIGGLAGVVVALGGLATWAWLMWQAYQGNEPELPVVGPWARKQAEKEMI